MRSMTGGLATSLLILVALSSAAQAQRQDTPKVTPQPEFRWKMVSLSRTHETWSWMKWFSDELHRRSNGRVEVRMISMPELGLTGFELIRVLKAGLVDIGEVVTGYVAGDLPIIEGASLTGLQPDWEASKKSHRAWDAVYRRYEDKIGGKYLGIHPYDWNAAYCTKPVRGLEDIKGVKIRIFSPAMALFWKTLGAQPVSMAFAELYSALDRKVLDCAHTGPASGVAVKLYEVAKYLVDLRLGHQPGMLVVSKRSWDAVPPDIQQILVQLGREHTERTWVLGWEMTQREIKRNQAEGVEWIPTKEAYRTAIDKAVRDVVLPDWLGRVPDKEEARRLFNELLAPQVGFTLR